MFKQKKSALWPSENLPAQRFFDGLIHTLTGRPTDRSYVGALSLSEHGRAKDFVREHFIVIDPPTGMPYTPAHLLAYFETAIAKYGVEHYMLDPWNKCDHSTLTKMSSIEPYLVHTLGLCTKWSQDTRQCLVLTAHPKRAEENMGYGKTRPVPTGGTISCGQTWENMAHYVGAMHRPYDFREGDTHAAFYAHKSKDERNVARRGAIGAVGVSTNTPVFPKSQLTHRSKRHSPPDANLTTAAQSLLLPLSSQSVYPAAPSVSSTTAPVGPPAPRWRANPAKS